MGQRVNSPKKKLNFSLIYSTVIAANCFRVDKGSEIASWIPARICTPAISQAISNPQQTTQSCHNPCPHLRSWPSEVHQAEVAFACKLKDPAALRLWLLRWRRRRRPPPFVGKVSSGASFRTSALSARHNATNAVQSILLRVLHHRVGQPDRLPAR